MREKTTSLRKNDRAILNAYTSQCLTDSIHSIEQVTTAAAAQPKPSAAVLREQKKNQLANKNANL